MKPYKIIVLIILGTILISNIFAQSEEIFQTKFSTEKLLSSPVKLIPFPQKIEWQNKTKAIKKIKINNIIDLSDANLKELYEILKYHHIQVTEKSKYCIDFEKDESLPKEAYSLFVWKKGIRIKSQSDAGFFYGIQTLFQLIDNNKIQLCKIEDYPIHSVRGFMLDVGRNYQSMTTLKKQLDIMSRYKMNVFHWHLTDKPAFRIESKIYPQLTAAENHRPTRDPGKFYTYDEIRELMKYAKTKQIQVIPEIDMPGHSDSFTKSMGVKMASKKGMEYLENILNEFFHEIPLELCPSIHLGSDEIHIDNPDQFISKMVNICHDNDRDVIIWNPGLKANEKVIRQTWQSKHIEKSNFKEIDSWNNYVNNGDPMIQIHKLFLRPIGYGSENEILGGILCLWPDVNLENGEDAFIQNPHYSSLLTYSWATWTADIQKTKKEYLSLFPKKGTETFTYFSAFEDILLYHKKKYFQNEPFLYFKQNDKEWKLIGPFDTSDNLSLSQINELIVNPNQRTQKAYGNTLFIKDRFKLGGYFPDAKTGQTIYAITNIYSKKTQTIDALIGFESPLRANRIYNGIPENGSWDANGGCLWINDKLLPGPNWENPRWKPSKSRGWGTPVDQERPWHKEELYWTRKPAQIRLEKGWNRIIVKIPSTTDYQNWMFTFIPLNMEDLKFSIEGNK